MEYNFDIRLTTKKYDVGIDTRANYGYFERQSDGAGGGLWLDYCYDGAIKTSPMLVDYDGFAVLPKEVIEALRHVGIDVDVDFE